MGIKTHSEDDDQSGVSKKVRRVVSRSTRDFAMLKKTANQTIAKDSSNNGNGGTR
jgi:hypothetical protein